MKSCFLYLKKKAPYFFVSPLDFRENVDELLKRKYFLEEFKLLNEK